MSVVAVAAIVLMPLSLFFLLAAVKLRSGKWLRYLAFNAASSDEEIKGLSQKRFGERVSLASGVMAVSVFVAFASLVAWEVGLRFAWLLSAACVVLMFLSVAVCVASIVLLHREKAASAKKSIGEDSAAADLTRAQRWTFVVLAIMQIAIQAILIAAIAQGSIK